MSRVAKSPVVVPAGVTVDLKTDSVSIKGSNGELNFDIPANVKVSLEDSVISFEPVDGARKSSAMAGTVRSLVNNMVEGVSKGFERKLILNGVGYRAKASGNVVNLTLGFSHPIDYVLPEGVKAESPTQTEVVLKSVDKQLLGQTAAEIRAFRPPEPYKGKGVRYSDEVVRRKEAKKK